MGKTKKYTFIKSNILIFCYSLHNFVKLYIYILKQFFLFCMCAYKYIAETCKPEGLY